MTIAPSGLPCGAGFAPPPPAFAPPPPAVEPAPAVLDPAPATPPVSVAPPDPLIRWNPEPKRPPAFSALVVMLAGAAAAYGALRLPWLIGFSPLNGTMSATGMEDRIGRLAAMTGILIAVLGLLRFVAGGGRLRVLSAFAALAALGLAGLAGWNVRQVHVAEETARAVLTTHGHAALAAGTTITVGLGLWLILGGSVLAFLAALPGLRRR